MSPQLTSKQYSRLATLTIGVIGILFFVAVTSFVIYGVGNFIIAWLGNNKTAFSLSEMDSISAGDANILSVVQSFVGKSPSTDIASTSTAILNTTPLNVSTSTSSSSLPYSDIQYVIFSLDGSRSINMWNETRQFSKDMELKGKPIHFTYFINPIYLITREMAKGAYFPPRESPGKSLIGYGNNGYDIKQRVEQINSAFLEGHEIGSHNVGHFNGSRWSKDEWLQEFNSFDSVIANVQKNNKDIVIPPWSFNSSDIVGFRAPELGVNSSMYKALAEKKYLYDSSGMGMPSKYPVKDQNGIWHIGLGIIKVKNLHSSISNPKSQKAGKNYYVLSMDYNFWMYQSNVRNVAKKGTPLWNSFFSEMKDAYLNYFNSNYEGNHAPVVIGHHFSTWNDGVYWEVMKSFAEDVCGKPKVKCVTFKEYVNYLNSVAK
jgi:peptidoglycan/xylan/chitin deacetylase (PgdA/CDA1 family)